MDENKYESIAEISISNEDNTLDRNHELSS